MTASGGEVRCVGAHKRLTIDLDLGVEPITGSIEAEPGTRHEFAGLIELISLIDRLRSVDPDDTGEEPPR